MLRFVSLEEAKEFIGLNTNKHDEILTAMIEAASEDVLVPPAMASLWENSDGEIPDRLKLAVYIRLALSMRGYEIALDYDPSNPPGWVAEL